ncbi:hypothetical protein JJE66_33970 [Bradyrhizobium diazoefficiens]|uniref:hypothetical protein n=1 Tax=Bradyrhizobium diazoefficiens TaxID=1355477 RepID=UPI00190E5A69|nr:hypothetical protein [Bradyrhizobium diazoefficiens]MBK3666212.1 hypothetical protein [Bradyrhizobium diazoefficiens]
MGNIKDKILSKFLGKAKQAVAEISGDGKLAEEGKQQVKKEPPGSASMRRAASSPPSRATAMDIANIQAKLF